MKCMLKDCLRRLPIWAVDVKCNGSRAFGIDNAVDCHLDLRLRLCHGVKGLKEVTIAGDLMCRSSVNNSMIGRSPCRCHIDRHHRVWRRVRDRVRMYDGNEE